MAAVELFHAPDSAFNWLRQQTCYPVATFRSVVASHMPSRCAPLGNAGDAFQLCTTDTFDNDRSDAEVLHLRRKVTAHELM